MRSIFETARLVHCWAAALDLLRPCPLSEASWGLFVLFGLPAPAVSAFLGASFRVGVTSKWAHPHFGAHWGSPYVPLPEGPASPSLLQWAQRLWEDRGGQKDGAVPIQPGAGADEGERVSGEGQLATVQGSKRDLPTPLGQESGLQASGFSSGAAPGIAYCGGRGNRPLHGPTEPPCSVLAWDAPLGAAAPRGT